jgi:Thioesterase-like superfamily
LFAGQLTPDDRTLARLTVELLGPVPFAPLRLELSDVEGGRRVQRRRAQLTADGKRVATAMSVSVLQTELDMPADALAHDDPFRDVPTPDLTTVPPGLAEVIGWENFHSTAVATKRLRVADDPTNSHQWVALTVPVVAGTALRGTEIAAAAADFASEAMHRRLPFTEWSFMNADLTLHLARPPVGAWIGMNTSAVIQGVGTGIASTQLFDAAGRVGQSVSTLVVERRRTR